MKFIKAELKKGDNYYLPDWESANTRVVVKKDIKAIYILRNTILQLAYETPKKPLLNVILLLIEPKVTDLRLRTEFNKMEKIFRPDVLKRLSIIIVKEGHFYGFPKDPVPELSEALKEIYKDVLLYNNNPLPRTDYKAEIYKILIYKWLMHEGPLTSDWLAQTTGCNYRTVANTLNSLGSVLIRHSDRRIELKYFPKNAWEWLLVHLNKSRFTKRYSDHSGQPRSIDSLLKRLARMKHANIAIAGTLGTQHHYPNIDLIGNPRLDLTVHCPEKYLNIDFIEKLDPGLKEEVDTEKPASLVIHFIRRRKSFFKPNPDGIAWADPVECLLDLHEMYLEPQALEFLNFLQTKGINS